MATGSNEEKRSFALLVRNADQVVCISNTREAMKTGKAMEELCILTNASVVVGKDGLIAAVGKAEEIEAQFPSGSTQFDEIVDGKGLCVLPGLVDGHTHPVWAGDRSHEFKAKLAGATYLDIHKMGGGIGFTVAKTAEADEATLLSLLLERMSRMLAQGTTLAEAKSGYGLDTESELRLLRVLHTAGKQHPVELVSNFCGAHSVPRGKTAAEARKDVIERQIPAVVKAKEEGTISPELIDVFCEKGVFELEDSRAILEAGQRAGLAAAFHGDELTPTTSAEMAAEIGALSVSHLECITEKGIRDMAEKKVIGVLLPTTAFVLRIHPPPARAMIDAGVPVALGSDFNPNAHCLSMPFVMNLACVMMRMTMAEALVASTLNAAASLRRSGSHGSIETGKVGDLLLLRAPTWEHIAYQLVDPPIHAVFKKGKRVFTAQQPATAVTA